MQRLANKQILGIIDATADSQSLSALTTNRPIASLMFSGRYRLIDFMLSNMMHAGIDSVGLFSHHLHNSLKGYLGSGKTWDLDRKNGGLFFYAQNKHDRDNGQLILDYNKGFFERAPYEYVAVAPGNIIGRVNFLEMLKQHKENKSNITQAHSEGKELPIYLLKRELFVKFLESINLGEPKSLMGFVESNARVAGITPFHVNEKIYTIDSLMSYYKNSMRLLAQEEWKKNFPKVLPVITKSRDEAPTKYTADSNVKGAVIANGCIIEGEVVSSVIARGARIGKNSIVRNSIIMPRVVIGDNCFLDGVIVDKEVTIEKGAILKGNFKHPIIVPKGATVYKEWK